MIPGLNPYIDPNLPENRIASLTQEMAETAAKQVENKNRLFPSFTHAVALMEHMDWLKGQLAKEIKKLKG